MDEREELLSLVRRAREHVAWRERGGVVGLPRGEAPVRARSAPEPPPATVKAPLSLQAPPVPTPPARPRGAASLKLVREELGDCRRCRLASGRTQLVFGVG